MTVKRSTSKCPECRNTFWEIRHVWDDETGTFDWNRETATCTNCSFERPYNRRKARTDTITPTQNCQIEAVRRYLEKHNFKGLPLHRFEYDLTDYGQVSLVVETLDLYEKPLLSEHWHIFIGRRGKVKVASVSCPTLSAKASQSEARWLERRMKWS